MRHAGTSQSIGGGQSARARVVVLLTGIFALAYALAAFVEPWLESRGIAGAVWLRLLYAPVCHQLPERCLAVGGLAAAACARCTGLYAGGAGGLLLFAALAGRPLRLRRRWFVLAVAPTLLDVAAPWLGLPGLGNLPRFLLSLPTGLVLGLFLGVGLADLAEMLGRRPALPTAPARTPQTCQWR